jgi:hypothetical protein
MEHHDRPFHELRVALNGERFYTRAFNACRDVARDADETLRQLLAAGWLVDDQPAPTATVPN